jgi:hypothetical protein
MFAGVSGESGRVGRAIFTACSRRSAAPEAA